MTQQSEAMNYFNNDAKNWNLASMHPYSTISERNNAVLDVFKRHKNLKSFLDVGCGTGQLAIAIDKLGAQSAGVDFAQEMIEICRTNAKAAKSKAIFKCASIFDIQASTGVYDLISAQGFIEYISEDQLSTFIDFLGKVLRKNGCAVIGSRNRLFNSVSMNEYTKIEVALGALERLVIESQAIQTSNSVESLFRVLGELNLSLKRPSKHPYTGIDVETRHQYSPGELITKFKKANLFPEQIYPINFQPLPQSLLRIPKVSELKNQLANYVATELQDTYQLVPFSSSFVLSFIKK